MIKASELRVGNLVQIDANCQEVIEITGTTGTIRVAGMKNVKTPYNQINGIPLTPEWLERFGFEVYGSEPYWKYADGINGMFKNNRFRLFTFQTHGDYVPVDYVHQLQNLYFALTGQELELKDIAQK